MLEASMPLRAAYYGLLNGKVRYQNKTVPVFDSYAPIDAAAPYIIIADTAESNADNKRDFGQNILVTLDVVTMYNLAQSNGRYDSEAIAGEMMKILLPYQGCESLYAMDNFQCVAVKKVNGHSLTEVNDTKKVFRKIIQLSHSIKQVKNG